MKKIQCDKCKKQYREHLANKWWHIKGCSQNYAVEYDLCEKCGQKLEKIMGLEKDLES